MDSFWQQSKLVQEAEIKLRSKPKTEVLRVHKKRHHGVNYRKHDAQLLAVITSTMNIGQIMREVPLCRTQLRRHLERLSNEGLIIKERIPKKGSAGEHCLYSKP